MSLPGPSLSLDQIIAALPPKPVGIFREPVILCPFSLAVLPSSKISSHQRPDHKLDLCRKYSRSRLGAPRRPALRSPARHLPAGHHASRPAQRPHGRPKGRRPSRYALTCRGRFHQPVRAAPSGPVRRSDLHRARHRGRVGALC